MFQLTRGLLAGILTALMLLMTIPAIAQDPPVDLNKFRLMQYDGTHFEGTNGQLTATEFTGLLKGGQEIRLTRDDIKSLEVAGPSQTKKFAILGGLSGGLMALMAVAQVEADPYHEVNQDRVLPVTLVLMGGGAAVGAIIGSSVRNWQKLPLTPSIGLSPDRSGLGYAVTIAF